MSGPGFLFVTGTFWDETLQKQYSAALPPIYRQYDGAYVVLGGGAGIQVVEGLWHPRGLVFARFESVEAVARFRWSAEYRAAASLRQGGGAFTVLNLPGLAAPQGRGGAYLFTLTRAGDASRLQGVTARVESLARVHGGRTLVDVPANSLRPLEGAFFDTALTIQHWASEEAQHAFLADSAYAALATERAALGEVVVLARKGIETV